MSTEPSSPADQSYTYADAGVSIAAGNALVRAIGPLAKATRRPGADADLGGFGGMFDLKAAGFTDPLLVAANDGVGTKLKLAIEWDRHEGVGVDLVAMCANDLIVQGAEPLFFLDYYATGSWTTASPNASSPRSRRAAAGRLRADRRRNRGNARHVCEGDYDLAGFCVGAVERDAVLTGQTIAAGDVILGLASSGVHSNGFSLVRRLAADRGWKLDRPALFDAGSAADRHADGADAHLCRFAAAAAADTPDQGPGPHHGWRPAREHPARPARRHTCVVDADAWAQPRLMAFLQAQGAIEPEEMARTFNCGIGMAVVVAADQAKRSPQR
jgi:phosphoribosylformylglycinamidine cyclo-ligase